MELSSNTFGRSRFVMVRGLAGSPDTPSDAEVGLGQTLPGPAMFSGEAWPLPEKAFSHPRSNGTFAKVLRSYVRERKPLSLSEAICKMSLMPAQTMEGFVPVMKKKGRLQEGMDADIVIFDPHKVAEAGAPCLRKRW